MAIPGIMGGALANFRINTADDVVGVRNYSTRSKTGLAPDEGIYQ